MSACRTYNEELCKNSQGVSFLFIGREEREGKILGKLMVKHLAYKRATTRNGRGEAEVGFDLIKTGSDNSDAVN